MNEEQIERRVEISTDAIDRKFLRGEMTQAEYDGAMRELSRWADIELARRSAP